MALNSQRLNSIQEESPIEDEIVISSLAHYVLRCYEEAKTAKSDITERLLRCERQRRGEYDPDKLAGIRDTGGSDIFMMLTDIKCRASESWIKDVMFSSGEKSWSLTPTVEPEVPVYYEQEIVDTVVSEAENVQMAGQQINPKAVEIRLDEIYTEVQEKIKAQAKESALAMEKRMMDKMQQSGYQNMLSEVIYDFVTFPCAIIKAPIIRKKKFLKWSDSFDPEVSEEIIEDFERVSPYDIFPSPNAVTPQDGYIIQRHQFTRKDLELLIDMPSFNKEVIQQVLMQYGNTGLREMIQSDSERSLLEGRNNTLIGTELIEGIEFWGNVSGHMLKEYGMTDVEDYKEYEVNVWIVGSEVIKCAMNTDPLHRRPYSKCSFEQIPNAFWGVGLPEIMRDVQVMCNGSARALANNMALASAPQVDVSVDRLPEGEDLTKMYPWKIWQTTSDRTGGGQPAIKFYQPNMNAETLLNVYQYFQKIADEVTGVPNYIYGSSAVSGAGRTASGLSMLMENASKGIKQAILNIDQAVGDVLQRLYDHIMIYDDDPTIKGDCKIVASGIIKTLLKESVQQRRNEFLQLTSNPVDLQIMGQTGRAELLREIAKVLNMDVDKLVPDPETIKAQEQMQQLMAMQQQQPQQAPQQPQQPPQGEIQQ
tara:strand:- start:6121 stop:8067 length:1947 start_codon:yes stop_codon:yes gene_type:complete